MDHVGDSSNHNNATRGVVLNDLYSSYRVSERAWLTSLRSSKVSQQFLQDCSLHYGELAFLLAGLKPCVLVQLPSQDLTLDLYQSVIQQHWTLLDSFKQQQGDASSLRLKYHLVTHDVQSPEMPLTGCVLLWSEKTVQSHPQAQRIRQTIDLLVPSPPSSPSSSSSSSSKPGQESEQSKPCKPTIVSESDLAVLLDLPGRLPASEEEIHTMTEVSYWHQEQEPTLLTAFAAQPDDVPNVLAHFKRYKEAVHDLFGIQLKFHMQSMAQ